MGGWLSFLSLFARLLNFLQIRVYSVLAVSFFLRSPDSLSQTAKNDRKWLHRKIPTPTVSMACKLEKRRVKVALRRAKRQDSIDQLIQRLKLLGSPLLEENRGKIALNLNKFASEALEILDKSRAFRRSKKKALKFIVQELYRLISHERDPDVAISLIELEQQLERFHYITRLSCWTDPSILAVGAGVLEQKPNIQVRYAAFTMILRQVWRVRVNEEVAGRIARVCAELLTDWRAKEGQMPAERFDYAPWYKKAGLWEDAELHLTMEILFYIGFDLNDGVVTELFRNDDVMTAVFDVLRVESPLEERIEWWEPSHASNCLSCLLGKSSEADRAFLKERYPEDLKMGLLQMSFGLLDVIKHVDLAAFVATDSTLLNTIWKRIMRGGFYDPDLNGEKWTVAAFLLEYGLKTDESELQRMLGLGFLLPSARYFASIEGTRDDKEARTFRSVLTAHPEYSLEFRKATENGKGISHTYQLGRTIPQRISKPAVYILEDYVDFN